jgi:rhamnosyltransferase subunit B
LCENLLVRKVCESGVKGVHLSHGFHTAFHTFKKTAFRSNMSTRILSATVGSHGDAHPFAGIGAALRQRGHQVVYMANDLYRPMAQALGLEFVSLGTADEFRTAISNPDVWHPRKGFKAVASFSRRITQRTYEQTLAHHQPGNTVAVGSSLALGMRVAQEKIGIPLATVHLSPMIFRTVYQTPVLSPLPVYAWQPHWMKRAIYSVVDRLVLDPALAAPLNDFRKTIDLPPVRRVMVWLDSPLLVLGMFPEWFAPRQPDWPAQMRLCGFPMYDERDVAAAPPEVIEFLRAGSKPIVFTPGSAMVHGRDFFTAAVEACNQLNRRGLLLTRYAEQIPSNLPATVMHCTFAPFSEVLPHAAALVHHGGIGTMSQALAAGVPQAVMPMSHDQPDNACRALGLGVARVISPKKFDATTLAAALRDLLDSPAVAQRCTEAASRFRGADGIRDAADAIESRLIHGSLLNKNTEAPAADVPG